MPIFYKTFLIIFFFVGTSFLAFNYVDHLPPEKIGNSPANEAVWLNDDGAPRLFYVNRPGDADKIMSMGWTAKGWSEAREEFALPGKAYYALQMVNSSNNELVSVFHVFGKGDNGYRGRHLDLWVNRRVNGEWGEPFKIYDGYVGAIRGLIRLESGRLLLAFSRAVPEREKAPQTEKLDYGWNNIVSMYSDDGGESWDISKNPIEIEIDNTKTTRYGGIEPELVEMRNGKIWMLIRTTHGVLYQSFSEDGGESWEEASPTSFISSDSPSSVLRLKDGRLIMFYNSCQRWDNPNSYAMGGREVLHAAISADDGLTWKGNREVAIENAEVPEKGDRGSAYSSAIEIEDGKILLVSGQGESKAVYTLEADWLNEKSQVKYLSFDAMQEGPSADLGKEIAKSLGDTLVFSSLSLQDAIINFPASKKGSLQIGPLLASELYDLEFAMTDHFSAPSDSVAFSASMFHFAVSEYLDKKKVSEEVILRMEWNLTASNAQLQVFIGKDQLATFNSDRATYMGLNYLRIKSESGFSNINGLVSVDVSGR
ncbi:sialidase family protein [Cyclobacterium qasimii]|uniref:Sialidase n=2 Tax=Cyclobacterium qasimii TaxID=1350429 RepID=S7X6W0_9BACT|nr:sialidase family protein [Cyclobacterium qasimii]EPR71788.1 Sialidase [Cyclobacterium qasimii M12-11B]GEO22162.1 hypothetical protein CQA01_26960 [Cyclobacterium qasimii]